ncbi:PREDICTED: protein tramtrack, beta isoform-like [Nicrophorus vespilloides]|uniref:Protein tramtrack, beta isoform-like n=1 Tax=Nicrophorus vespilloides TaxID=110193 RepID=A0ABM1NDT8_NICVS|nr:PREDICTED: protein tramtrack, beta isoform-like [Nicrophorus vespilloides]
MTQQQFDDNNNIGGASGNHQRFLLRWHRHAPTLTDQLPAMFEEGLFSDVTLSVSGQQLRAHRLILASCSTYFLQIFQEADRTQVEHPHVVLVNAHIEDIRAILSFMYKGECCVYRERIPELIATAKNLKVCGLSDMEFNEYMDNEKILVLSSNNSILNARESPPTAIAAPSAHGFENVALPKHRDVPETCKCFVCGKYLSNQYNLRVHIETHEETYHACSSCPHVSRSRDALRKHMSYRHPDKYSARKQKKLSTIV